MCKNYNQDINTFILFLWKGFYPYKYILCMCVCVCVCVWLQKIPWNSITWKRNFYSNLNIEDITDADCAHTNRVCKDFEMKNIGNYHDLYVQSDTL